MTGVQSYAATVRRAGRVQRATAVSAGIFTTGFEAGPTPGSCQVVRMELFVSAVRVDEPSARRAIESAKRTGLASAIDVATRGVRAILS